jgi:peptide-methionine (R)-S-oxide reductase
MVHFLEGIVVTEWYEGLMNTLDSLNQPTARPVNRRIFFYLFGAALAGFALWRYEKPESAEAEPAGPPEMVSIVEFTDAGVKEAVASVPMVVKSETDWRKQLGFESFEVTRHADTEIPFTGKYWNLHDKGVYRCVCCDSALFLSDTKFESGTGWPSFWAPIAKENIVEITDSTFGMTRTAVSCRRCDAHLGHVFDDGPQPTGLRYCMNSVSLRFVNQES